jgi:LysR family transcriptional regulator for metE and metH
VIEIRHLKLIKLIVEEGSMANAIDKLFLTPSALSHQLKEAELQLGAKIFFRLNKKLVLTPAGKKVYDCANLILDEITKLNNQVKELLSGETGRIRICTECYTSYHWLPSVLKKFNAQCPRIEVRVVFEAMNRPLQKLLAGEIDMVITNDPLPSDSIEFIELFKDEMGLVIPYDHPLANKSFVDAEDFTDLNLIIHSEPIETVFVYKKLLKPNGKNPKSMTILPLTEAAIEMVRSDMGVMVMPKWTIKPYLVAGDIMVKRLTEDGLYRHQYLAILKNGNPDYFNFFIRFLREEMNLEEL